MVSTTAITRTVTHTDIVMHTNGLPDLRLMQLISPALPIGAFTYSQGLEWAVECGWVSNEERLQDWLLGQMSDTLAYVDIPLLARMYQACEHQDYEQLKHWSEYLLASRETSELRQEEINRGRALATLLVDLGVCPDDLSEQTFNQTQAAGFALAANAWGISLQQAALGYAWGWLENQVAAAIKLVPLGQTSGQRVQLSLAAEIPDIVDTALKCEDHELGASAPAMAIASCLHETQYTRLFRS